MSVERGTFSWHALSRAESTSNTQCVTYSDRIPFYPVCSAYHPAWTSIAEHAEEEDKQPRTWMSSHLAPVNKDSGRSSSKTTN